MTDTTHVVECASYYSFDVSPRKKKELARISMATFMLDGCINNICLLFSLSSLAPVPWPSHLLLLLLPASSSLVAHRA